MSDYKYTDAENWSFRISESYGGVANVSAIKPDRRGALVHLPATERVKAAQALAGDEWRFVPADSETDTDTMQRDLDRILAALGLGTHARPISPHQVVIGEVLPAIETLKVAEPDRPEPIDPADVRVGDVVEVEANDGSWMVRGCVDADGVNSGQILVLPGPGWTDVETDVATVRLVSRPEPEPDPEQVEALAELLRTLNPHVSAIRKARELVRRGVTVGERDD